MSMLLLSLLLLLFKMSQVFGNCSKRTCCGITITCHSLGS